MNRGQIKSLTVLILFAIFGIGPLSLTCLLGYYVVAMRPVWFLRLVREMYDKSYTFESGLPANDNVNALSIRLKCYICLSVLLILDIAPVPVTGIIAIPIVLVKPVWFEQVVLKLYGIQD